jgi:hypothetical protein
MFATEEAAWKSVVPGFVAMGEEERRISLI